MDRYPQSRPVPEAPALHPSPEPVRIYVGTDRSQLLAVKVLEHSIRRHTSLDIAVTPMLDLDLPDPEDPRQGKRTGFSFARFAIPELAGHAGRALYLDADMLVFRDIAELWSIPFDGAKVVIQDDPPDSAPRTRGAPKKRIKQTAVMLLDCSTLDWDPRAIIAGLDGRYTYEDLVYHLCILEPSEIRYAIPFAWNSLEAFGPETGLLHYTDMTVQPWVSPENRNGHLWLDEVRLMLGAGALHWGEIEEEVRLGYFRPSLLTELRPEGEPDVTGAARVRRLLEIDKAAGFVKHAEVYETKRRRTAAIEAYEKRQTGNSAFGRALASGRGADLLRGMMKAIGLRA